MKRVVVGASAAATVAAILAALGGSGAAAALATSASASGSRTFAGWEVAEPITHITSASVTFVVPTITCHQNFSGVGPAVVIASTVHNHTYSDSGGGIAVACQHLVPVYVALPIVNGFNYNDHNVPISAGDTVTVSVKYGSRTTVTLVDHTDHQRDVRSGKRSRGQDAYFGDSGIEINHHGVGLDPFTKTRFTAARVNGRPIGSLSPRHFRWVDSAHLTLVSASRLSHGTSFTTTFVRSN